MTNQCFQAEMRKIEAAYSHTMTQAQTAIYWEKLKHIEDDTFKWAIDRIITTEPRFPAISTILAHTYSKPYGEMSDDERRADFERRRTRAENEWA